MIGVLNEILQLIDMGHYTYVFSTKSSKYLYSPKNVGVFSSVYILCVLVTPLIKLKNALNLSSGPFSIII